MTAIPALAPAGEAHAAELTPCLEAQVRSIVRRLAAATVALGLVALAGWALDVEVLKSGLPGLVTMKANTAFAFVLVGVALTLQARRSERRGRVSARVLALVVAAIGLLSLIENLAGVELGIDQILFTAPPGAGDSVMPGLMAPLTALAFTLLGAGLATFGVAGGALGWLSRLTALVGSMIALVNLLGFLYGVPALSRKNTRTPMSLLTACGTLLLSAGLGLLATPGLAALFTNRGAGGVVARRLLPAAVMVPVVVAWLRLQGQRAGLYGTELGVALVTVVNIALLAILAGWSARLLDRLDRAREAGHDELARSEERFRATFEQAAVGIAHVSLDGRFLRVNRKCCEITGYERDELLGKTFAEITHPDDLDADLGHLRRLLAGEIETYAMEKRYLSPEGVPLWVQLTVSLLRRPSGEPDYFVSVIEAIGARKRLEAELRDGESRLRQLVEGLPLLVWTCTPEGACDYLSPQWLAYTGIGERQQLGSGWLMQIHADDRAGLVAAWGAAVAAGSNFDVRFRIRGADGVFRWFQTRAVPLRGPDGAIVKWFGTNTDVEELERAKDALAGYSQELARSNDELQEFAFVASHDLQEPLRKIVTFAALLREREASGLDEEARDFVARMASAAERMSELVERLLELSRVTTQAREFVATDLGRTARQVLGDLEVRIRDTGARVTVEPLPTLAADPEQMRRLLQNLIGNALKFHAPERPPAVRVWSERLGRDSWRLSVGDDGIGFDEKYLERIFKPFQRLHSRGEYPGTGMGLAICRRIVARHGGELTARSRPGEGSTFEITLPERQQGA